MLSMSDVWLKFAERVSHTQRDTRLVSLLNIGVSGLGLGANTPQEDKRVSSQKSARLHLRAFLCLHFVTPCSSQ